MVFLVTSGRSNVDTHLTIPNANALKMSGVQIYVVAVGSYVAEIDEMVKIASYPPEDNLFRVKDFAGLLNIIRLVVMQVSPGKYQIVNYDAPC